MYDAWKSWGTKKIYKSDQEEKYFFAFRSYFNFLASSVGGRDKLKIKGEESSIYKLF